MVIPVTSFGQTGDCLSERHRNMWSGAGRLVQIRNYNFDENLLAGLILTFTVISATTTNAAGLIITESRVYTTNDS
jgi:hypothetical protein